MANVFLVEGPIIDYGVSVANPLRGTRGRRTTRMSISSRGSGISKSGGPPPGSVLLCPGSGFVFAKDGYLGTNFHVVDRA